MLELCARAHALDTIETILAQGFKILEITLPCSGGLEEERAWMELARERELTLIGHGPNEGKPLDLDHLENKSLPKFKQAIEAAGRLGAKLLTIHFNVDSRWIPPDTIKGKIGLLERLADWGSEQGVKVNLENLSEASKDLKKALIRVSGLGLTLDVGHAMLTHPTSTAPAIIRDLFDWISHLHLHDNHGGKSVRDDLHLIPGEGKVAFAELFHLLKERGYNRTATLELAPHEMAAALKYVTDLWQQETPRAQ